MDRRLAGHHGLPHSHLPGLALHQHLPGLLAHHGDLLTHHLPGLLSSHHLPLLAHHRPHLLPHPRRSVPALPCGRRQATHISKHI